MSEPRGAIFLPAKQGLHGDVIVPGDKSISHRAVLLGAVNSRPLTITGFLRSADTMATVVAVRSLGVGIEDRGESLVVGGRGWAGLSEPENVIDVANAGTLIRLLPRHTRVFAFPHYAHGRRQHPPAAHGPHRRAAQSYGRHRPSPKG